MAGSFLGALTGGAIGSAVVRLVLDSDQYNAQLAAAKGQTATSTAAMGKGFSRMGALGSAALAGLGTAAVAFGAKAIEAASGQEEAANKVAVSFGSAAGVVEEFAETSAEAFGISETAALQAAGGYGVMLQTAGLTREEAAQMSVELVGLAGDLASFNDVATSDALDKLRAGLAGEAEPLRQMGILLSEGRVKTEAYATGIAEAGAELTEAQKVQARYSLILKDSTLAQGDFARTSDSLANQQRKLTAAVDDLTADIGKGLLPVVKDTIEVAGDFVEILQTVGSAAGFVGDQLDGILPDFGEFGDGVGQVGDALSTIFTKTLPGVVLGAKDAFFNLTDALTITEGAGSRARDAAEDDARSFGLSWEEGVDNALGALEGYERGLRTASDGTRNFANMTDEELSEFADDVESSFDDVFGTLGEFEDQFDLTTEALIRNSRQAARQAERYKTDLEKLSRLDIDESLQEQLIGDPGLLRAFISGSRSDRQEIEGFLTDIESTGRGANSVVDEMLGLVDDIPTRKDLTVSVRFEYPGYDPSIPIPGV